MKFSEKDVSYHSILQVTKNQDLTVSLKNTFLETPKGGQIDPQRF